MKKVKVVKKNFIKHFWKKEYNLLFTLSIVIGIIGGLGAILFRFMIDFNKSFFFDYILPHISYNIGGYNVGIILIPALGGLIVGPLIYKFAKEAKGHGVPEVIEAIHLKGGIIRPIVAFVKIAVSSITIGSGGSAGREGPIAQIGAVFGSMIGRLFFKAKKHIRLMVSCGVAAGIGATFNAPLGGAIFAMEVISTQTGLVTSVPILISAVVGDVVMTTFFGFAPAFESPAYIFKTPSEVPVFIIIGLVFGLLSFIWSKIFYRIERTFDTLRFPERFKPVLGGLLVGGLGIFFFKYGIMGVGYEDINAAIGGSLSIKILIILGVVKIFATSFTIGSGGSGGIFAPSLYIGSMFGAASGLIAQHFFPNVVSQPYAFALIGMGALFAGACRAPVTALIMIPEMTNNHYLLIPMIIVSTLSYFVSASLTKSSMYLMKLENRGIKIREKENILEDVLVEDIMTRDLIFLNPDMKISEVLFLSLKNKHPGFPIIDSNKRFYGFVNIYDLNRIKNKEKKIQEIINENYPSVGPSDHVYHALNVMINHNLGRIPVLIEKNDKKYIVGIVSKTDVVKAYEKLMR